MEEINKKPKILIFEDDKDFLWILKQSLEAQGFKCKDYVSIPEKEKELIDLVLLERPDIISTDLIHPGIDGYKIVKLIKENERTKKIPIIILTSFKENDATQKGLEIVALADEYYCKAEHRIADIIDGYKKILIKNDKFTEEDFVLDNKTNLEIEKREDKKVIVGNFAINEMLKIENKLFWGQILGSSIGYLFITLWLNSIRATALIYFVWILIIIQFILYASIFSISYGRSKIFGFKNPLAIIIFIMLAVLGRVNDWELLIIPLLIMSMLFLSSRNKNLSEESQAMFLEK